MPAISKPSRRPLLRTRGGISDKWGYTRLNMGSSPHTRRYFRADTRGERHGDLFSAHAEVFPVPRKRRRPRLSLLRTRGGISICECFHTGGKSSSPHTRRYFRSGTPSHTSPSLFSAHAEVFPKWNPLPHKPISLLRTRGGISMDLPNRQIRAWLFSAHAEVFP